MTHLSTHVLDASTGRPAVGVPVTLTDADGVELAAAVTDGDGRVAALYGDPLSGVYRLRFDTAAYFAAHDVTAFYPEVVIAIQIPEDVTDGSAKYHVPLLLSPFAYSTYRGS